MIMYHTLGLVAISEREKEKERVRERYQLHPFDAHIAISQLSDNK